MMVLVSLMACGRPEPLVGSGLVGDHPLNPFPVGVLHTTDGRVDLEAADFGLPSDLTPLRTERLAWRTGFSPAQTSVIVLPTVRAEALPDWRDPRPGETGVRLLDRDDGVWLPVMAELDAHPEATDGTLLIRPLVALPDGHDIAVVVTTEVTDRLPFYDTLFGRSPPAHLEAHVEHFEGLSDQLESLGVPDDSVAVAWDFTVASGTEPMESVWSQITTPNAWAFDDVRVSDAGDAVPPDTYRVSTGSFTNTTFLDDDRDLRLQPDGSVTSNGTEQADLVVVVPESVADAPAGTVPIVLFGHGLFSTPENYLDTPGDASSVNRMANELGAIVVATRWRGLSTPDLLLALSAAADFTNIHRLTDRMVQGQANTAALAELVRTDAFLEDPALLGRSGQRLGSGEVPMYYGISLGGIEGAVFLSHHTEIERGVLHVPGGSWSTMLERSSNWVSFAALLEPAVPDPVLRQRLYATSQLWWDPVDPIAYTEPLSGRGFLVQEARFDQQVPNLTTRMLMRSVGADHLAPVVSEVSGLPTRMDGTLAQPIFAQFDPEQPDGSTGNRPAPDNGSHEAPRHWDGALFQTVEALSTGQVRHRCGTAPCSASNRGE